MPLTTRTTAQPEDRNLADPAFRGVSDPPLLPRAADHCTLHPLGMPVLYDFRCHVRRRAVDGHEYATGATIANLIAEVQPVPIGWAAAVSAQVCAGFAAAHALGLVHRDLKPGNVMSICSPRRPRYLSSEEGWFCVNNELWRERR